MMSKITGMAQHVIQIHFQFVYFLTGPTCVNTSACSGVATPKLMSLSICLGHILRDSVRGSSLSGGPVSHK